ncbi:patatin-like phospholipase family protein [Undibacterium sp. TJN25]|uniref:patatin-like phospholipase family protein n=1 Tax=Undibacterium sp. TJN25 TaxID=3413056 RepID=UPI003BF31280
MKPSLASKASAANRLNPDNNPIVLVLQGGGALGAYQAGVFEALHENDLVPDWVVGTSIGAINAALIAGNPQETRLQRLKEFWQRVSHGDGIDLSSIPDQARKANISVATLGTMMRGVPGFFSPRLFSPFAAGFPVEPDAASFYETQELAGTLKELVDFDYLNAEGGMRLTVNALKVTCGELASFDNRERDLGAEHILASGALPPGFPPVRIDGELYWDGGLYSNTPLETVLNGQPHANALCFMVDLWSAQGEEPRTLDEVQTRQKDVMFASRSMRHIDAYLETHKLQRALRDLYKRLPAKQKNASDKQLLSALGCDTTLHIVRIPYAGQDWHMAAKDINFSRGSIEWRWEQGYRDGTRAIKQAGWLANVSEETAVVIHELAPEQQ